MHDGESPYLQAVEVPQSPQPEPESPEGDPWGPWGPTPAAWLNETPPARAWVLRRAEHGEGGRTVAGHGYFPLGKVGVLAGAGGVGKSMLAAELALAVAAGVPLLGGALIPARRFRVVWLAGEEDADEMRRRIYRAAERLHLSSEARDAALRNLTAVPLAGNAGLALSDPELGPDPTTEAARALVGRVKALAAADGDPLGLVVLDPLARFAGEGTEADNTAATRFVRVVQAIASEGPSVLVVHHTSQAARQWVWAHGLT